MSGKKAFSGEEEDLAQRLIQVMIAAAMLMAGWDSDEEGKILKRLQGQALRQEERRFILTEIHDPTSVGQLVAEISDL